MSNLPPPPFFLPSPVEDYAFRLRQLVVHVTDNDANAWVVTHRGMMDGDPVPYYIVARHSDGNHYECMFRESEMEAWQTEGDAA